MVSKVITWYWLRRTLLIVLAVTGLEACVSIVPGEIIPQTNIGSSAQLPLTVRVEIQNFTKTASTFPGFAYLPERWQWDQQALKQSVTSYLTRRRTFQQVLEGSSDVALKVAALFTLGDAGGFVWSYTFNLTGGLYGNDDRLLGNYSSLGTAVGRSRWTSTPDDRHAIAEALSKALDDMFAKIESDQQQIMAKANASGSPTVVITPPEPEPPTSTPGKGPVVVPPSPPIPLGRYHALVIGNNAYKHLRPLKTAVSDATAVAEMLDTKYGFKVRLLTNVTREAVLRALSDLRANLTERDNALIYYAGHGHLDTAAERGYWLPVDAREDESVQWISSADITDTLKAMKAKQVLVVADSCYAGTLARDIRIKLRTGEERDDYVRRMAEKRSRTALMSGGLEPVEDSSGGGKHSVFAKAFLAALDENTGVLEGQELYTKLKPQVMVNSEQTPAYEDIRKAGHDVGADFLFVRK